MPNNDRPLSPTGRWGGFLRLEDFRKLLDDNPGLERIELSNNGEIFLNPALLSILELAHQRGVKLTADDNLNKVRPEVLEGLVKYQFRRLVCSIDGASEETYPIYRVRGKLANVIDNIRKINKLKQRYRSPFPELVWKFIVFGHNEHELPVARELARELDMEFQTQLNHSPNYSPVRDPEAVRAATGMSVASRDEYGALHGRSYHETFCHQLWDDPQINWDGKVLGCCVNFWGDFGGNAFRDGLRASVNTEQIVYARAMLRGRAPPREDVPCTRCEQYEGMHKRGQWLERGARRTVQLIYWDFCRRILRWLPEGSRRTVKLIYWDFYRRTRRWLPAFVREVGGLAGGGSGGAVGNFARISRNTRTRGDSG